MSVFADSSANLPVGWLARYLPTSEVHPISRCVDEPISRFVERIRREKGTEHKTLCNTHDRIGKDIGPTRRHAYSDNKSEKACYYRSHDIA